MVKIHLKRETDSQFLFETSISESISSIKKEIVSIYNGRIKLFRLCDELDNLSKYGVILPKNMKESTEEDISNSLEEMTLKNEYRPAGEVIERLDPSGVRNGQAPNEKMVEILRKIISEVKTTISVEQVKADQCLSLSTIKENFDCVSRALRIVYPAGLPKQDIIYQIINDSTDEKEFPNIIEEANSELWWASKEMFPDKKIGDYIGRNEKTKIIVKLQKCGMGVPSREPIFNEETHKEMMMKEFRKREELKKLDEDDDDSYLDSKWADGNNLKCEFQGLENISWRPK